MKKILFLFVVSTSLFVSCDKNDDNDASTNLLHGKWEVTNSIFEVKIDGKPASPEDFESETGIGTIVEFRSDNKVITTIYDEDEDGWVKEEGFYIYNESEHKIEMTNFDNEEQVFYTQTLDVILLNSNQLKVGSIFQENLEGKTIEIKSEIHFVRK